MKKTLLLIFCIAISISINAQTQNSLSFDGTDDYVTTNFTPPVSNAPRTIEAYIKTTADAVPSADGQQVIADYGTAATGSRFTFCILWNNALRLEVQGNGISGSIAINDGQWHHVAVVYDASNASGSVSLYVDGNLDTQGTPTVSVNTSSTTPFTIGRRVDGVRNFTGEIDEVRVWDGALTQNDLITGGGSEICPSSANLLAYYQFDQGMAGASNTGINTVCELVNQNDGTLNGFSLAGATSNWVSGASISTIINTDVSVAGATLTAAQAGATYQWIDCATGSAISGATSASYTASANGDYAVDVTFNSCTQRSCCTNVSAMSIDDARLASLKITENPSTSLSFNGSIDEKFDVAIYSLTGKELLSKSMSITETINPSVSSGLYIVSVSLDGENSKTFKWIKE